MQTMNPERFVIAVIAHDPQWVIFVENVEVIWIWRVLDGFWELGYHLQGMLESGLGSVIAINGLGKALQVGFEPYQYTENDILYMLKNLSDGAEGI